MLLTKLTQRILLQFYELGNVTDFDIHKSANGQILTKKFNNMNIKINNDYRDNSNIKINVNIDYEYSK